jgi:hypothetical protein
MHDPREAEWYRDVAKDGMQGVDFDKHRLNTRIHRLLETTRLLGSHFRTHRQ